MLPCHLESTLFPYTTLFRSRCAPKAQPPPKMLGIIRGRGEQHSAGKGSAGHSHVGGSSSNPGDRKSTRLNSSHLVISYAVFCLKKKNKKNTNSSIHETTN